MIPLVLRALRFHLDAHLSIPANFFAAVGGMLINNILFLYGMWLMLFDGKEQNIKIFPYYLTLISLAYVGWGGIMFVGSGLRRLGERIDDGTLEPMLGTPRHPLVLVAIGDSDPAALGDVIQGFLNWLLLFYFASSAYAWRSLGLLAVVVLAFLAVFILAGSISFFMNRGSFLSDFIVESTLSFTLYPTGKMFTGYSRYILYVTPALLTGVLPMQVIESTSLAQLFIYLSAVALFFMFSLWVFSKGLKRYRGSNLIGALR